MPPQYERVVTLHVLPPTVLVNSCRCCVDTGECPYTLRMRVRRFALLRLLLAALAACEHVLYSAALPPGNNSVARIHKVGYVKVRRRRRVWGCLGRSAWCEEACTDALSHCLVLWLSRRLQTHKTGSTTLGAALFRFGARNHLVRPPLRGSAARAQPTAQPTHTLASPFFLVQRFYCQGVGPQPCRRAHIVWPGRPLLPGQVYDLQLNHFSGNGVLRQSFGHVIAWYKARHTCTRASMLPTRRPDAQSLCLFPPLSLAHAGRGP